MNWIKIFIPIEPIPKKASLRSRNGMMFKHPRTRKFENDVQTYLKTKTPWQLKNIYPDIPISLDVTFWLKAPQKQVREHATVRPDIDNLCKSLWDAANGILWEDDKQIVELVARKMYDWTNRKVGIELKFRVIDKS